MKELFSVQEDGLHELASGVVSTLATSISPKAKVLFLEGDLGAGKTTFTKAIAKVLGIDEDEVHSPTFILKKEYRGSHDFFKRLIHIDAYRFDDPEEVDVLKLAQDIENQNTLIVIEWPSKLGGKLDEDMTLTFSVIDDATREVSINYSSSNPFARL